MAKKPSKPTVEWEHVERAIAGARSASVSEPFTALLPKIVAELQQGPEVLALLQQAPWEQEFDRLSGWLRALLASEPPPREIAGLYFGIMGDVEFELYLSGSLEVDEEDESGDWAANPDYFPEGRGSESTIILDLANNDAFGEAVVASDDDGAYMVLSGVAFAWWAYAVRRLASTHAAALLHAGKGKKPARRTVAFGHDNGEIWVLGTITSDGWRESNTP